MLQPSRQSNEEKLLSATTTNSDVPVMKVRVKGLASRLVLGGAWIRGGGEEGRTLAIA